MSKCFIFTEGIYDTMDLFSNELITEFTRMGHRCHVLHMESMDEDIKQLIALKVNGIDGVITFNNLAYNLGEEQGGNLWDALDIPYVNILMDHPFHYKKPLENAPKNSIVCCIDRNHVDYIRRFFPDIRQVEFLPHGGCGNELKKHLGTVALQGRERDIQVLYAGNLSRFLIEQLIPDFGQFHEFDGIELSNNVLNTLIHHPNTTTEAAIEQELGNLQVTFTEEELGQYIHAFRFLDGFAVSFFREQAVRILVESGIPVHVLGIGWEKCDWTNNENFIFEGKVDAPEVLDYMLRSKVVLNTLTWFKDGCHDRIYNGMLSEAAVVSDSSVYLQETLINHGNIELFELERITELPDIVSKLLQNDDRRQMMAGAGREAALQHHTWKMRAETILSILDNE